LARLRLRSSASRRAPLLRCAVVLALLAASVGCGPDRTSGPDGHGTTRGPNVLLVTLDTTRVDHLGCYGYPRETTPNLDGLAQESILYTRAYSTSSWTLPAHASLFTGKITYSHGARYDPEGPLVLTDATDRHTETFQQYRARGLSPDERTLAGLLAQAGWHTGAVVAGPWLERTFGLATGFRDYDDSGIDPMRGRRAVEVTDRAIAWLERADRPFFLFLNYYDPHGPYDPPATYRELFLPPVSRRGGLTGAAVVRALYDAEIRYMDDELGRLFDHLRAAGLWEETWIVVLADHGELLGEHGLNGHGLDLYEGEIHVPLLVKAPGPSRAGTRVESLIQVTDVLPMLFQAMGLSPPADIQGVHPRGPDGPVVAELYPLAVTRGQGVLRALVDTRYKFLWNERGTYRLYDLEEAPGEERSSLARHPERARAMQTQLESFLARLPHPGAVGPDVQVDEATRRALEHLGYLE
jgi:arylsulfatase A-like enzyme